MKPFEEQFTAWVDGKLTGEELAAFERELATRPEAHADRVAAEKLGALLRSQPAQPLTNPDFFNLQLLQRIEAEQPKSVRGERGREKAPWFWSLSRLAWAGAACLFVSFVLFRTMIPVGSPSQTGAPYFAQVIESWPADESISATTVYNPDDNVTVLWIDGLERVPANYAVQ